MKNFSKKELLSIPNLMGYFRLLMIPAFAWLYLTASTDMDYYMAALVMGISSLTDMFDGMVARKFNMITEFGKFLDPLADKLSHGAILLCLLSRYPLILLMLVLYVIKEGFMLVMGILKLRQGKKLNGAKWFGKCCTALLYVVLFIFLLFPRLPLGIVNGLIYLCCRHGPYPGPVHTGLPEPVGAAALWAGLPVPAGAAAPAIAHWSPSP